MPPPTLTVVHPLERVWRPAWPCPLGAVLAGHRRGPADPTYRIAPDGSHWRGIRTPEGPTTLRLLAETGPGQVRARAWGAGAEWVLDRVPRLLGADDVIDGFTAHHDVVARAWRRHPHWRLGATDLVLESLVPAVLEQRVTGQEAYAGFRALVRRFGEPAPGPAADLGLRIQPDAIGLRAIPSWEWLRLPVDPARSRTVVIAARSAAALERTAQHTPELLDRRLQSLPGIGVWTSAEVRQRVLGDPDAISVGDYHAAADIGWALTGRPVGDDAMIELLEPYRPHRHRVRVLLALEGLHRPRRGPRMAPRRHLPAYASGPGRRA